ncbi:ARL14 effector protein isoform X1 [Xenopus tropicalis]|uniref:ADP ribosylation factor like GTPase 14 effector protein n=1 Tax=Xenopus tropicalis TaxID=8364 RepID=A0A5G3HFU6_XENTR|nr:ARL14 effector protein isoform X1 [Xenopus tropicalis]
MDLYPCSTNELKALGYKDVSRAKLAALIPDPVIAPSIAPSLKDDVDRKPEYPKPDTSQTIPFQPRHLAPPGLHPVPGRVFPVPPAAVILMKLLPPPICFQGRAAKALKSLQFANPGKQTEFAPETSKREKRRLQTKSAASNSGQTAASKNKVYDSNGILICNGMDLCDCLDEDCLGCFYSCKKCGSNKCGVECRCDRKWLYEQIEVEGGDTIRNKHVG